jgi:hypothetical protein
MANEQLFHLGRLVATPAALAALEEAGDSAATYLARHATGDWGGLTEFDFKANESAIKHGERVLSAYRLASADWTYMATRTPLRASVLHQAHCIHIHRHAGARNFPTLHQTWRTPPRLSPKSILKNGE